ncbi:MULTISPECIES: class I lanthipeptide [Chryseobacterium]|uniref:class I lanthipeptide n=1 Tax=Chryseobacterium TaxID=59732 RepID=UPI00192E236C|nr:MULTISPECIES: class I lanthipeptide [Chryseobacterium]MCC3213876.1 class I lanthipeptide [Chryseobacterium sp. X308]QRA43841.1 class I lanthipeptide [Chryseobacterium cucumeris]
MQKKKIAKLEIKKEDILNLSMDEAQKVIGGGDDTTTVPYTKASDCNTDQCSRYCGVETDPCSGVIEYSDLCGMSDNCASGWCQLTQDVSPECNRT